MPSAVSACTLAFFHLLGTFLKKSATASLGSLALAALASFGSPTQDAERFMACGEGARGLCVLVFSQFPASFWKPHASGRQANGGESSQEGQVRAAMQENQGVTYRFNRRTSIWRCESPSQRAWRHLRYTLWTATGDARRTTAEKMPPTLRSSPTSSVLAGASAASPCPQQRYGHVRRLQLCLHLCSVCRLHQSNASCKTCTPCKLHEEDESRSLSLERALLQIVFA